jgi:hypothetical protein
MTACFPDTRLNIAYTYLDAFRTSAREFDRATMYQRFFFCSLNAEQKVRFLSNALTVREDEPRAQTMIGRRHNKKNS